MPKEWWKSPELSFMFEGQQASQNKKMPQQAIGGGQYGATGNGVDGIPQPNKKVPGMGNGQYDAHEQEFIFDANSTQAIGSDLLTDTMKAAQTGKVDLNKLREAIGQPSKPGFQTGGATSVVKDPVQSITKPAGTAKSTQDPIPNTPITPAIQDIKVDNMGNTPVTPAIQDIKVDEVVPQNKTITPGLQDIQIGEMGNIPSTPNIQDINIDQIPTPNGDSTNENDPLEFLKGLYGEGSNEYIEALKNRYTQDMGGAGAAGTAALKQEAAQAGMSPEQIASMGVTRQRDVEEQTSDVLGQIATQEAQMGVQAAKDVIGIEQQQDAIDYAKKTDKFNQQLSQGDYSGAALTFNETHGTDIDFSKAIDADNLQNFNTGFNGMTTAAGSGMSYDDWYATAQADGTFEKMNLTESDAKTMYENMRLQQNTVYQADQMYDDLVKNGVITQDQKDDIMTILAYTLSHPDGISVEDSYQVTDADGNEIGNFQTQEDADNFVADNNGEGTIGILKDGWISKNDGISDDGVEISDEVSNINNAMDYLDQIGASVDSNERVQQYLDAHGGEIGDISITDWNTWDTETESPERIRNFFNGDPTSRLEKSDKTFISEVEAAQKRIDSGEGTEADEELVGKLDVTLSSWDKDGEVGGTGGFGARSDYDGGGAGGMNETTEVNKKVYQYQAGDDGLNGNANAVFNDETKQWAKDNVGRLVEFDGKYYEIADNPIETGFSVGKINGKSFTRSYSYEWKADGIRVIDPETGDEKIVTFGVKGSHWDQDRDKGKYDIDASGTKVWDA